MSAKLLPEEELDPQHDSTEFPSIPAASGCEEGIRLACGIMMISGWLQPQPLRPAMHLSRKLA